MSSGLSISVFFWATNVNTGSEYIQMNAPRAPKIPAIEPTCGYVTARTNGPIKIEKFKIMLTLSDEASGFPVASKRIFDLKHAKIKLQVAVS